VRPISVVGADEGDQLAQAVCAAGARLTPVSSAEALIWAGGPVEELTAATSACRRASWVQLPSAGVERYLSLIDSRPDITWTCAKAIYADSVAEHALALALAVRRGFPQLARAQSWTTELLVEPLLGSREIVTILGGGGIAVRLAQLLAPFGLDVRVARRTAAADFDAPHTASFTADELDQALTGARILFVTLPLTADTAGMIGAAELARLAPGAVLVNVGRGAVVDTTALLAALGTGKLRGAGLDVTEPEPLPAEHPLFSSPGVLVTSHTSNPTPWQRQRLARLVEANTRSWLAGEALHGQVDRTAGY
jgi:phosphoglycerate dehydrogenase-like enzyme